jgi:hypothetical protein
MPSKMRHPLLSYITQEAMHFLLQLLLPEVPVCSVRHVRQQGRMPVLQQHEDQGRQVQVPLSQDLLADHHQMYNHIYNHFCCIE